MNSFFQDLPSPGVPQIPNEFLPRTIKENKNYDPTNDIDALEKAMKGMGTDEDAIIKVIAGSTNKRRLIMREAYQKKYKKNLMDELKSELGGKLQDLVLSLFLSPADHDATCVFKAMDGIGTNEEALIDILCTRNNYELKEISTRLTALFKKDLIEMLKDELSGSLLEVLSAIAKGRRREKQADEAECKKYAELLYKTEAKKWESNQNILIPIFVECSIDEIKKIAELYEKLSKKPLLKIIEGSFSGDIKRMLSTIVYWCLNPTEYFSTKIFEAIDGLGTNDKLLIRTVVNRLEIDFKVIAKEYKQLYSKGLLEDIKEDTSGDYSKLFSELLPAYI